MTEGTIKGLFSKRSKVVSAVKPAAVLGILSSILLKSVMT